MTVPDMYTDSDRASYNSQRDVTEAWLARLYPSHNIKSREFVPSTVRSCMRRNTYHSTAVIYSSPNFSGYQFDDGSGILLHYNTIEALRTPDGLVINNTQCWGTGFAHCSPPCSTEYNGKLPLNHVGAFMNNRHTLMDITDIWTFDPYDSSYANAYVAEVADGEYGIVSVLDHSITGSNSHSMFRVESENLDVDDPTTLLIPNDVSTGDIVNSREFTKSRLSSEEAALHKENGGTLTESQSPHRRGHINMQYYRTDLRSTKTIRQGEWFFIPVPELDVDRPYYKPLSDTWKQTDSLPEQCSDCGAQEFTIFDEYVRCNVCANRYCVYPDSMDAELLEQSHIPRDIVVIGENTYVRGTVKHSNGQYDTINLGDIWHRAVQQEYTTLTL